MLSTLSKIGKRINSLEFGQSCFYIGTLLLATTNLFAGIFYLISLVISFSKKPPLIIKDKWNLSLLICSIILIISALNTTIIYDSTPIYRLVKNRLWDESSIWFSLFNWIPLFLSFSGFQIYLKEASQRIKFATYLLIGSIPVIISLVLHKWFQIYGPFEYLNGLIVFYMKPIDRLGGYAGLFSNPNYAGIWLSASLPFCFLKLNSSKQNRIKFTLLVTVIISTIYCILITNSRNSLLGIFIATSIMTSIKFLFITLLIILSLYSFYLGFSTIPFIGSINLEEFFPKEIFVKLFKTNLFSKFQSPRIAIWAETLNLIGKRPILGWGAATFSALYMISGGTPDARHTHNMPLEIAQAYGIPAAIILTSFVFVLFFKSWLVIFFKNKQSKSTINKAWISSMIIISLSHLADITYYDGRISILIWALLAGLKCILDEDKIKSKLNNQI